MYQDNYAKYLEEVPADIRYCRESGKRIVFGYTSDLDIVFHYAPETFAPLFAKHLKAEPQLRPHAAVGSLEELACTLAAYMIAGAGAELDITNYDVCTWLTSHCAGTRGLGGTAAFRTAPTPSRIR